MNNTNDFGECSSKGIQPNGCVSLGNFIQDKYNNDSEEDDDEDPFGSNNTRIEI